MDGFDTAPAAFVGMLKGANVGKMLIKVSRYCYDDVHLINQQVKLKKSSTRIVTDCPHVCRCMTFTPLLRHRWAIRARRRME